MRKVGVVVLNTALIILTIAGVFMTSVYVYLLTGGRNKIPSTVNSTYATTVYDKITERNLPVLEANYYSNKNNSGCEVIELRINAYSDYTKQAVYSRGFQMVWEKNGKQIKFVDPASEEVSNVFYYDTYDYQSFETGHVYKSSKTIKKKNPLGIEESVVELGDPLYIDIDGQLYAIRLDGSYTYTYWGSFDAGKSFRNIWGALFHDWGRFSQSEYWTYSEERTECYDWDDLLLKMRDIIKSCSNGTGDSVISLIDLGDFLHVYAVDKDGKVANEPIGDGGTINSFYTVQTHYDNRGMTWAKQSMFKSVAGESGFNLTGIRQGVEYWKAITVYNLTERDFEARYSQADNGFYYSLSSSFIDELNGYDDIKINVEFNLANLDVNVLGFDYYALNGVKVNSLKIRSKNMCEFRLMTGSLKDTGLSADDITTINIDLINTNSGVTL